MKRAFIGYGPVTETKVALRQFAYNLVQNKQECILLHVVMDTTEQFLCRNGVFSVWHLRASYESQKLHQNDDKCVCARRIACCEHPDC